MTEQEKINAERNELNKLINKGISFYVERTINVRSTGFFSKFKKPEKKTERINFTIQEPTLSTLDRLSFEQIALVIDEKVMQSEDGLSEARKMTGEHAKRLAKIVALAVLGQDYVITIQKGNRITYEYDDYRLTELTEMFYENIKPSKLYQLVVLINTMSNIGDFINSIRLMSAARTTMPILVEQKD